MTERIYLAAPYTGTPELQRERAALTAQFAARLQLAGFSPFAPTVQGEQVEKLLPPGVSSPSFWMQFCLPWLAVSDTLLVLPLPGWEASKGIAEELQTWRSWGRTPRIYLHDTGGELPPGFSGFPQIPSLEPSCKP